MSSDDDLPLRALDISPEAAERLRRRALAILDHERGLAARPKVARAHRIYSRYLEPLLVVGATVVYLTWAVRLTLELLH